MPRQVLATTSAAITWPISPRIGMKNEKPNSSRMTGATGRRRCGGSAAATNADEAQARDAVHEQETEQVRRVAFAQRHQPQDRDDFEDEGEQADDRR